MSELVHKAPCPRSPFVYRPWNYSPFARIGRPCECPNGRNLVAQVRAELARRIKP